MAIYNAYKITFNECPLISNLKRILSEFVEYWHIVFTRLNTSVLKTEKA